MISLTRRFRFSASHRLHSQALSAAQNAEIFGKCNNPHGHGHNYVLEITVAGTADPRTGLLLSVERLDQMVEHEILRVFGHRNINADVPQFANLIPTTENIALAITDALKHRWESYFNNSSARLQRVYVQETERNSFEVRLPAAAQI